MVDETVSQNQRFHLHNLLSKVMFLLSYILIPDCFPLMCRTDRRPPSRPGPLQVPLVDPRVSGSGQTSGHHRSATNHTLSNAPAGRHAHRYPNPTRPVFYRLGGSVRVGAGPQPLGGGRTTGDSVPTLQQVRGTLINQVLMTNKS